MARGLIISISAQTAKSTNLYGFVPRLPLPICKISFVSPRLRLSVPSPRFFCNCASTHRAVDMENYNEAFSKRMAMAGLKPHHRIGLCSFIFIFLFPSLCFIRKLFKKFKLVLFSFTHDSSSSTGTFLLGIILI